MNTCLSIAGSDPSGGAGIQADLKTMTVNGVYAMCAITALTVQNTLGVTNILEVERAAEVPEIRLPPVRVDEGDGAVSVAAADGDARPVRRGPHCRQIPVLPAPELHGVKAVVPGRLKAVRERQLLVHRIQMGSAPQGHPIPS